MSVELFQSTLRKRVRYEQPLYFGKNVEFLKFFIDIQGELYGQRVHTL
jgi:hypothetical protein